jgi:hypothetical protein
VLLSWSEHLEWEHFGYLQDYSTGFFEIGSFRQITTFAEPTMLAFVAGISVLGLGSKQL